MEKIVSELTEFFLVPYSFFYDITYSFTHLLDMGRTPYGSPDTSVLHGSLKRLFCQAGVFDQNIYIGCWSASVFLTCWGVHKMRLHAISF